MIASSVHIINHQLRILPHRHNVILGIENHVKKDCLHNAPWSISNKLHAVHEQSWSQIEKIQKFPKIILPEEDINRIEK